MYHQPENSAKPSLSHTSRYPAGWLAMPGAVGEYGHGGNAGIGDVELVELAHAEAHLVGGAHRSPVRRHDIALRVRVHQTTDAREAIVLRRVEGEVHVCGAPPVAREPVVR